MKINDVNSAPQDWLRCILRHGEGRLLMYGLYADENYEDQSGLLMLTDAIVGLGTTLASIPEGTFRPRCTQDCCRRCTIHGQAGTQPAIMPT